MIIDDDYCQYEMWRIVNKAENDALNKFSAEMENIAGNDERLKDAFVAAEASMVYQARVSTGAETEESVYAGSFAEKMFYCAAKDRYLVTIVDFDTGEEMCLKATDVFEQLNADFAGKDFFERTKEYCENVVAPEDREIFRQNAEPESIRKVIGNGEEVSITYRAVIAGKEIKLRTAFAPLAAKSGKGFKVVKMVKLAD